METDLVEVARKISDLTLRTGRVIHQLTVKLAEEAETYIDQFLDSLVMQIASEGPLGQGHPG